MIIEKGSNVVVLKKIVLIVMCGSFSTLMGEVQQQPSTLPAQQAAQAQIPPRSSEKLVVQPQAQIPPQSPSESVAQAALVPEQAPVPEQEQAAVPVQTDGAGYPLIPVVQHKQGLTEIPLCTSFSLQGDNIFVGELMQSASKHFFKEMSAVLRKYEGAWFTLRDKGNNDQGTGKLAKMTATMSPLVLGLVGTESFFSIERLLQEKKMALLFPTEGINSLRQGQYENVIYFRPSYKKELEALIDYTLNKRYKRKIAVLYEASEWGEGIFTDLKDLLTQYGIEPVVWASFQQGTVEIGLALDRIAQAKRTPNAIFCLTQPRAAYTFVRNALNVGLHNALFIGLSNLNIVQSLIKTSLGIDIVVSSVVPNPQTSTIPLINEYKQMAQGLLVSRADSPYFLEAFIGQRLLVECLMRLQGPPTIENIIQTLETFQNMDFLGLPIHFNNRERVLGHDVWINPGMTRPWVLGRAS
ncbi:ABC transporter substrate-binding protein [bacterium]|nr:MAG: ABC transporter substrate-binding protein [bacterium]